MSKKRLGEILDSITFIAKSYTGVEPLIEYAKEQTERVDELERKKYDLREDLAGRHSTVEELNEKIDELWKQNKRLREAIQEAMELNHDENFNYDVDKVLLKALESESG